MIGSRNTPIRGNVKRTVFAAFVAGLLALCASAQAGNPPPDSAGSSGGWRPTTENKWQGTGKDFGRGWRTTKDGQIRGTGENFGRGWRPSADGGWRGTGENFGRGWEPRQR